MGLGRVETYLNEKIKEEGSILLALVDPAKLYNLNVAPEDYGKIAKKISEGGAAANMLGGSIGVSETMIDAYAKSLREYVKEKPIIIFPSGSQTLSREVDAIWFMSARNSRNPYWIVRAAVFAAPIVKAYNIEPINLAYIICEPGGAVGYVAEADLIPRSKEGNEIAQAHALAAQYSGFGWVYFEAGSNAEEPVPNEMIYETKKVLDIHLGTGGGIKTPEQAREKAKSGADYIFVGTAIEELIIKNPEKIKERVEEMVEALQEGAKKRKLF